MTASSSTGTAALLRASELVFEAGGRRLLDHVSFTLREGALVVLLGPNGAGKSLLLRVCHGLVAPTSGELHWRLGTGGGRAPHAALVQQRPVLLRRSVRANLEYALAVRGVPRRERRRRAEQALERAGLLDLARSPARVLSLGEQQRLALARARVLEPRLLFLDEATASLDPASTAAVEDGILEAHQDGCTVVWITHDLRQARRVAGEILFLHRGRLLESGSATSFFARPVTAAAQAYLDGTLGR